MVPGSPSPTTGTARPIPGGADPVEACEGARRLVMHRERSITSRQVRSRHLHLEGTGIRAGALRTRDAALVRSGGRPSVARVDGGTSGQQRMGERGPAVVGQRPEESPSTLAPKDLMANGPP